MVQYFADMTTAAKDTVGPVPEGESRRERVVVRLTTAELHTLQAGQQSTGDASVEDFVRRASLLAAAGQVTETE